MVKFVSSDALISRIKTQYLKSFNATGMINSDDFYYWIKECLYDLGLSAMQPAELIMTVDRYKAEIPKELVEFYSITRLTATERRPPKRHLQHTSAWYLETSVCDYQRKKCCDIEEEGDKIVFRTYFEEQEQCYNYCKTGLLKYIPNRGIHGLGKCHQYSPCIGNKNQHRFHPNHQEIEFHQDEFYFHFGFTDEEVLLKYHAFPLEDGLPMIPSEPVIQRYIQDKIIAEVLRIFYINSTFPDIERRKMDAERTAMNSRSEAISFVKLPKFSTLLAYKQHQISNFAYFER